MDNAVNNLANQGQGLANAAADRVQSGIRDAGTALSNKADDLRDEAVPVLRKVTSRTKELGRQTADAAGDFADSARDALSSASDSVISYTKENPVKALMIAAASGALLFALAKAIQSARD